VILQVGAGLLRIGFGEGAQLRGRHRHRPALHEQVFQADLHLADQGRGHGVEGPGAIDLEDHAHLQVILQVLAHARQRVHHRDLVLLQQRRIGDARHLQDMRRTDGAGAQDGSRLRQPGAATAGEFDAGADRPCSPCSMRRRLTCEPVMMVRLPSFMAGRRKALEAFQRTPRFWLTSK
jgi:hypothetical protein